MAEAAGGMPEEHQAYTSNHGQQWQNLYNFDREQNTTFRSAYNQAVAKARWHAAVQEARNRGLDCSKPKESNREVGSHIFRNTRRHPFKHAQVLLHETSLPFQEIAEITGLNLYQVVSIKLKLRKAA